MAQALVDVVVVAYYPGETLAEFLDSARKQQGVASITVVDNAPDDDVARATADAAGARYASLGRNGGYGAGANAGAAQGSAPWILVSNADIRLHEGALDSLVSAGEAAPVIGAVGPRVLETDGSLYPSARPLPGIVLGAGHALFSRLWPTNPWTKRYRLALDPDGGAVDAGWLSGSCFAVRRMAWEQVGGFDEGFFMFFEDVDLGRRLGEAGWRLVWTPTAAVTHLGGHSYRSDPAPMLAAHHASARRYVGLIYPRWWQAPLRLVVAGGLAARQKAEVAAARRRTSGAAH